MFNEYSFLRYCENCYLEGLDQERAHEEIRQETVSESVKSQPIWQLVCWLGDYLETTKEK